jgi:2-aminoadipate transaminase
MIDHDCEAHIERIREVYRARRDAMLAALEEHFPEDVRFTRPAGGLFLWVELPDGMGARELLARALEERVAFVPGESFFPNGGHENTLRLNFSAMPEERITEGIRRLARVLSSVAAAV